ncbi:unnamed protein product [marine sediment metagenome]|uniref:Uncharacterized protein n=1 Tax=marine sediment metagenome TaxID=412755 RepID=X0TB05_9ZZZZ
MKVCPYCIATKGLKGSDLIEGGEKDMGDEEVFAKHIEDEHNIPVRRKGETTNECMQRFKKAHPETNDPAVCKCPSCKFKRGDVREALVNNLKGLKVK